jgi:hypothetical protein
MVATFAAMLIVARISEETSESRNMRQHEFTLVLIADPNEEEADKMYGAFNDGTIATIAGVPQIHFHRASESLEEAIRSAIGDVRSVGFDVARVEMEPDAVVQPS